MGGGTATSNMFLDSGGGEMETNCDVCGIGSFRGPPSQGVRACEACPKGTSNTAPASYAVEGTAAGELYG